jgi:hypothetical protein
LFAGLASLIPRHLPIDKLDVMATQCSSWRWDTKFESVFSEMQNKFRKIQTEFRRILTWLKKFRRSLEEIQTKFRGNSEEIQIFLEEI